MNRQSLPFYANMMDFQETTMSPELPGTYVNLLVQTLQQWNVSAEQLLAGTGISTHHLEAPFWYIDFNIFNYLLERAILLTHQPAISLYLSQEMKVSCYGHIGVAAKAAENLGQAIKILEQYIGLHCLVFKPKLNIIGDKAYLYFDQPLQKFKFNNHGVMFLVLGFSNILKDLAKTDLNIHIEFKQPAPNFYENNHLLNCSFNKSYDCLIFDRKLLDFPLETADLMILRLIQEQCKRDIEKLSLKQGKINSIYSQVKQLACNEENIGSLTLKQVAQKLHISERTLQRQLTNEQTSFQNIIGEIRRQQAENLLRGNQLSIKEISERLGYADISHFSRAFKKWTSVTPKFYREASLK